MRWKLLIVAVVVATLFVADQTVHADAAALLERPYRVIGGVVEDVQSFRGKQLEADQDGSDLGNGRAAVSTSDGTHARLP